MLVALPVCFVFVLGAFLLSDGTGCCRRCVVDTRSAVAARSATAAAAASAGAAAEGGASAAAAEGVVFGIEARVAADAPPRAVGAAGAGAAHATPVVANPMVHAAAADAALRAVDAGAARAIRIVANPMVHVADTASVDDLRLARRGSALGRDIAMVAHVNPFLHASAAAGGREAASVEFTHSNAMQTTGATAAGAAAATTKRKTKTKKKVKAAVATKAAAVAPKRFVHWRQRRAQAASLADALYGAKGEGDGAMRAGIDAHITAMFGGAANLSVQQTLALLRRRAAGTDLAGDMHAQMSLTQHATSELDNTVTPAAFGASLHAAIARNPNCAVAEWLLDELQDSEEEVDEQNRASSSSSSSSSSDDGDGASFAAQARV